MYIHGHYVVLVIQIKNGHKVWTNIQTTEIGQITQLEKTTKDTFLLKRRESVPKNSHTSSNVYTHTRTIHTQIYIITTIITL